MRDSEEDAQRCARVVYVPVESVLSVDGGHDLFATVQPELPHRRELVALVGRLWPRVGQGEIRLGGCSGHIGALSGMTRDEAMSAWRRNSSR
ncbi:hypothetical protein SK854_35280 [Lentzea sp. BCCO 10_0061]|uniref:Uncharacterized protein n=1 Tax=Lentzea sokolovensis TaxID=3095429 RepID=A0ABU4V6J0_9PSEU|nr:hypothetical protein [Lentzea sp. BCCO 10_0061]MDX8147418.1 hypothetical protein [Lentzea sp. BCCO 10_0061]